jgi:hypothetical protein
MGSIGTGSFEVTMTAGDAELGGALSRFEISKTFAGDFRGVGTGLMLSGGDPQKGAAGYVAMEIVDGQLGGRQGGFMLQQYGSMSSGAQVLHYEIVPGSGIGQLAGIIGMLRLDVDQAGTHRYRLEYEL